MKFTLNYTTEEFKRIENLLLSLDVDYDDISVVRNFKKIANNLITIMIIPDKNEISISVDPEKFTIPCIKALKPVFGMIKNICEIIKDLVDDVAENWNAFEITDLHLEPADSDKKETEDDEKCKNLTPVDANTSTPPAEVMVTKKTLEQILKENKKD